MLDVLLQSKPTRGLHSVYLKSPNCHIKHFKLTFKIVKIMGLICFLYHSFLPKYEVNRVAIEVCYRYNLVNFTKNNVFTICV